jgi:TPR repeat protein
MKGQKKYKQAIELINQLQGNFKNLSRKEVLSQHERYLKLVREAAYVGNTEAQFELGLNYEDQNYFIPNPMYDVKKRFYWYSKAANSNHPESCNNLASLYEKGEGTKKNLKKALFLYKKAYQLGCTYAKENYNILLKELSR